MMKEEELTAEELDLIYRDLGIFAGGWFLSQILFNGYESHVPIVKRVLKFLFLLIGFFFVRLFGGRKVFYGLLLAMSAGIAFLHLYWFDHKNGIHWRTAEPRELYLELIGKTEN